MRNKDRQQAAAKQAQEVATARDGFTNFVTRLGLGAQNILGAATYTTTRNITQNRAGLEAMYRGNWIAGAAVDMIAEDMTRAGITIDTPETPDRVQQMQTALIRLGIWGGLQEAIKWGRLYGGALAAVVIDGQDPSTPLAEKTIMRGQFRGLRVYDRWQLRPSSDMILAGKDMGLPLYYDVVGDSSGVRWHYSRVIRVLGIQLPMWQAIIEEGWGQSVIERLYDRLVSFDTATMGAASLINKAHLRTIQIDKLREILAAGGKAEENLLQMFHHLRMLQTNEGITLLDKEDVFQAHHYTFAGLSDMITQFGQQIAGALGIPLTRLFGTSPGGLNATGESDVRTYYDGILARQESSLREGVHLVLRVLHQSLYQEAAPATMDFSFIPLWQMSATDKAEIAEVTTRTVVQAYEQGIIDRATAIQELQQASGATGVWSNITEEQVEAARTPAPPTAPTMEAGSKSLMQTLKDWING